MSDLSIVDVRALQRKFKTEAEQIKTHFPIVARTIAAEHIDDMALTGPWKFACLEFETFRISRLSNTFTQVIEAEELRFSHYDVDLPAMPRQILAHMAYPEQSHK